MNKERCGEKTTYSPQKKRRLGTILTLSEYLASKHFGDSACFASVAKQFLKEADELFAAAQENAQWRYKSYLRMLGTQW